MSKIATVRAWVGATVGALARQGHFLLFGGLPTCRFEPSCSRYATEAIRKHGIAIGSWLMLQRIVRCRPGGDSGIDPVPAHKEHHGS
jgi:putative membrane protein insertion efficiency factor